MLLSYPASLTLPEANLIDLTHDEREGGFAQVLHLEVCRGRKLRGDEIRPTADIAFDVVLTGDLVSIRDIGDKEE